MTGLYWENENEIPKFCQTKCGSLIDAALQGVPDGEYDVFLTEISEDGCVHTDHDLETEDLSLQRGEGAERLVGVTDNCTGCYQEYGAQTYVFLCQNDQ